MKVYIVHEFVDDVSSVVAVYTSVDKAVAMATSIAANNGLDISEDFEPSDAIIVEYCDYSYNTVIWVDEVEVIE